MTEEIQRQQDVGHPSTNFPLESSVNPDKTQTSSVKDVIYSGEKTLSLAGYDDNNLAHSTLLTSPSGVLVNTYTDTQVPLDNISLPNTCSIPLDASSKITNSNVMFSSVNMLGQGGRGSLQNISLLSQSPTKTETASNLTQEISILDSSGFLNLNQDDFRSMNSILESLEIESKNTVDVTNIDGQRVEYHIQQFPIQDATPINPQTNQHVGNSQNVFIELPQHASAGRVATVPCTQVLQAQEENQRPCYVLPPGASPEFAMAKSQATAVKKAASNYIPDLSNFEAVCFCPPDFPKRIECPVEQLVTRSSKNNPEKQMFHLSTVHIIVISMEEFVAFQRNDELFVSVAEVVQRLIPEYKKDVDNYINMNPDCNVGTLIYNETQYLKQRRCVNAILSNWMMVSVATFRLMCRSFLSQKAFVRGTTTRLQNAANAPYFVKKLGKHVRCSQCGGAVKMLDIADEYVWLSVPLPGETEIRCTPYDVVPVPSSSNTNTHPQASSSNLPDVSGTGEKHIDIKHLFVSGLAFHSFQIVTNPSKEGDKTYVSLKELVEFRVLSIQALQIGLLKQQYKPRRAPSIVDDYYRKHSVDVDETLWIDILTIRCVCCMGKQSSGYSVDLYSRFGRGQWNEEVVCTIIGPDDRKDEKKVFTLYPSTYKINLEYSEPVQEIKSRKKQRETKVCKPRSGKSRTAAELGKTESVSSKQLSGSDKTRPHHEDATQSNISSTSDLNKGERKKNTSGDKESENKEQQLAPGIYYFKTKESVLNFLNTNGNLSDTSPKNKDSENAEPSTSSQSKQNVSRKNQLKKVSEEQTKNFRVQVKPARTQSSGQRQKEITQHRNDNLTEIKDSCHDSFHQKDMLAEEQQSTVEERVESFGKTGNLNVNIEDEEENVVTSTQLMDSDSSSERVIVVTNSVMPDFTPLSSLDIEFKEQQMVDTTILEPVCDSNMPETDNSSNHGNMSDSVNKVTHVTEEIYKSVSEKITENKLPDNGEKEIDGLETLSECISDNAESLKMENSNIERNLEILTETALSLNTDKNCQEVDKDSKTVSKLKSPVSTPNKETSEKSRGCGNLESVESNEPVTNVTHEKHSIPFLSPSTSPRFDKSPLFSSPSYREGKRLRKLYDKVALMGDSVNADESLAFLATVATECYKEDSDASQSENEEVGDDDAVVKQLQLEPESAKSETEEVSEKTTLMKQPELRSKVENMLKDVAKYLVINYKPEAGGLKVALMFTEEACMVFPELFKRENEDKKRKFLQIISSYVATRYYTRKRAVAKRKRKADHPAIIRQSKRKRLK